MGHMLSYTWQYKVEDIVSVLEQFCRDKTMHEERVVVWICCFCINQHRIKQVQDHGEQVKFEDFKRLFAERVSGIGNIIAMMEPWDDPKYVHRVWCNFELFTAVQE